MIDFDFKNATFAAANGYQGFKSYFKEIFNPIDYSALYILKGGPGTGKSTFMKRLTNELKDTCDWFEVILCSSDTSSLDGVILEKNGRRVAVIDGTAPHATDPIYPGAIEKIVNLGDCWHSDLLIENRGEITNATRIKQRAFEAAYEYLHLAGKFDDSVLKIMQKIYAFEDKKELLSITKDLPTAFEEKNKIRLFSAYGKNGMFKLEDVYSDKKICSIVGIYGSEYIFMSHIQAILDINDIKYTLSPSPLSEKAIDAITVNDGTVYTVDRISGANSIVDTSKFFDQKALSTEKSRLEFLWRERESMLWAASDEFKKASDAHFELEKIYSRAMDFDMLDKMLSRVKNEVAECLWKT